MRIRGRESTENLGRLHVDQFAARMRCRNRPAFAFQAFEVKLEKDLMAYRDSSIYTATRQQIGIDLLDLFAKEPRPAIADRTAGERRDLAGVQRREHAEKQSA